jgi:hypothetical protein
VACAFVQKPAAVVAEGTLELAALHAAIVSCSGYAKRRGIVDDHR